MSLDNSENEIKKAIQVNDKIRATRSRDLDSEPVRDG